MKRDLKVGDRVAVYKSSYSAGGVDRETGVVIAITGYAVHVDKGPGRDKVWYHIKQVRRLKPKLLLREFWLNESIYGFSGMFDTKEQADKYADSSRICCTRFVETKDKK